MNTLWALWGVYPVCISLQEEKVYSCLISQTINNLVHIRRCISWKQFYFNMMTGLSFSK